MLDELVLITGCTGHVGFRTLVTALQAGYSIRAAVRSESKKQEILLAPSIQSLKLRDRLSFVIIPDIGVDGAYSEAVKGATYILHIASPIVLKGEIKPSDYDAVLIKPAIAGTINILKAAIESSTIKRVVITSSIAAMADAKYFFEDEISDDFVLDHTSRAPPTAGPYPSAFHAYNASKVAALHATEAFVRDRKPQFDVTNIHPSFVVGKHELVKDLKELTMGTNGVVVGPVIGAKSKDALPGASVHVNDVAFMHVKALDSAVPAGSYIGNSGGTTGTVWQNATEIAANLYPKAVEKSLLPNDGLQPTKKLRIDARKTEEVMGLKFLGYTDQVKSVLAHFFELKGETAE